MKASEIGAMARAGYVFAPTDAGMTRSNRSGWPEMATSDIPTIKKWVLAGDNLVSVAKRGHQYIIDIDNPDEVIAKGFKLEWLSGMFIVDTPSGGLHASALHDALTESMERAYINVKQEKGVRKSPLILELKLDRASTAAPGMKRFGIVGKTDGVYEPRTDFTTPRKGVHPELLAWIQEHAEVSGGSTHSKFGGFHPDFDLQEFLEVRECTEYDSGMVGDAYHVVVDACPECGANAVKSTVAAGRTKYIFGGISVGFVCHACDVHRSVKYTEYVYRVDDPEILLKIFNVEDVGDEEGEDESMDAQDEQQQDEVKPVTTINWGKLADKMDDVRRRKKLVEYEDKNGDWKTKEVKEDGHTGDEKIFQCMKEVVENHGKMYFDAYPYVFITTEHRLYNWANPNDAYEIMSRLRLRLVQRDTDLIKKNMELHVLLNGEHTEIAKWGTMKGDVLYVNNGRGGMFKIDGTDEIIEVPNGTDGVLVLDPDVAPWPKIEGNGDKINALAKLLNRKGGVVVPDSPLCRHFKGMFEEETLTNTQYQQLMLLRFLSLFMRNRILLLPIYFSLGEQNSGKSTLWEKFMWLIEGTTYESGALPTKLRDFVAAITNHQTRLFDNIDGSNFNDPKSDASAYMDLMCKCSTGGKIEIAELYKTNIVKEYNLRCDLFLTARVNPFPSHRSDLSRRIVYFPVRKPESGEYVTVEQMKAQIDADSDEMKLETLVRLNYIVKALKENTKAYNPVSEMHSYENWSMRIADYEGWGDEMKAIWNGCVTTYKEKVTENSLLVEVIRKWIGSNPKKHTGEYFRAGQIHQELMRLYPKQTSTFWKSGTGFQKAIESNYSALRSLGVDNNGGKLRSGYKVWKFTPTPAEVQMCVATYTDSTREYPYSSEGKVIIPPEM